MTGKKLIVNTTVKALVNNQHLQINSKVYSRLETIILDILHAGMLRAKNNKRTTLLERDL